ncbi:MAG TPA: PAS domain-containing protein [Chitinophagaceae bacterium]
METVNNKPLYSFLQGGGEMGELTRTYPWQHTSIGKPDKWPQSLRTSLSILLNSKFPMFLFWGPELICFYNDAYRPSLGNNGKHPWALGKPGEVVWPEIWDIIKPLIDQVLAGGASTWSEDQLIPIFRNGKIEDVYWTFSYSPVFDESGKPSAVFVTCSETTEKVKSFKSLEAANQKFQNLVMQAPVAIAVFKGENFVADIVNDEYLPLVGKSREEFLGKPLFESLPETKEQLEPIAQEVVRSGKPWIAKEVQLILNRRGVPEICYFNANWEPIQMGDGSNDGFMAVVHEITEQVVARKELEHVVTELEVFKSLADNVTDFIGICDMDLLPFYVNQSGLKKIGLNSVEQIQQTKLLDFFFPEDQDYITDTFIPKVLKNGVGETEIRFRHFGTGEPIWMLYNVIVIKNQKNEPTGFATISKDITEQKQFTTELERQVKERTSELEASKEEIAHSAERLKAVFYHAHSGMFTFAPVKDKTGEIVDFRFVITNPTFASYVGQTPEALNGSLGSTWFPGYMNNGVFDMYKQTYLTGEPLRINMHYNTDGLDIYLDLQSTKVDEEVLVTFNDYTELKKAQLQLEKYVEELKRSNANLEEFAHAASHDLKEPIRKIHFFTDRLKAQLSDRLLDEERFTFARIDRATMRMSALIDDLLLYSHVSQKPYKNEQVDLNEKVSRVLEDLELDIQEKHAVITYDKLPTITGNRRQLQQLFQNIIGNALKYSKPGQPPEINITSEVVSGKEAGFTSEESTEAKYHLIRVSDNGIGFDQRESERIFQMFQRLHGNSEYRGSGVGLSIAQKVAENHNGKIIAEGNPGVGATFEIYLPVV